MAKVSTEEKLEAVQKYLNGKESSRTGATCLTFRGHFNKGLGVNRKYDNPCTLKCHIDY